LRGSIEPKPIAAGVLPRRKRAAELRVLNDAEIAWGSACFESHAKDGHQHKKAEKRGPAQTPHAEMRRVYTQHCRGSLLRLVGNVKLDTTGISAESARESRFEALYEKT
jgi:hypothetical protein